MKTLVLGGVRSGKSRYAESLARQVVGPIIVIATATARDEEMAARIAAHRQSRPAHWTVIEETVHLSGALSRASKPNSVIIVDCLTLWLSNLLCHTDNRLLDREIDGLIGALPDLPGSHIFVGNEVGLGIMPINDLARRFGDAAGLLQQRLAAACDRVVLMVAGLPLTVKDAKADRSLISGNQ